MQMQGMRIPFSYEKIMDRNLQSERIQRIYGPVQVLLCSAPFGLILADKFEQ